MTELEKLKLRRAIDELRETAEEIKPFAPLASMQARALAQTLELKLEVSK